MNVRGLWWPDTSAALRWTGEVIVPLARTKLAFERLPHERARDVRRVLAQRAFHTEGYLVRTARQEDVIRLGTTLTARKASPTRAQHVALPV